MKRLLAVAVSATFMLILTCFIYLVFLGWEIAVSQNKNQTLETESLPADFEFGELMDGEIFRTSGKDFELRYPKSWLLAKTPLSGGRSGTLVEQWRLIKDSTKPNSLKIDFEVSRETNRSNVFKCPAKENVDCQEVEINGTKYQKIITKQREIVSQIAVSTLAGGKAYRITAYPSANDKDLRDIESVFSTFKVFNQ